MKKKVLTGIILAICIAGFCFGAYQLFSIYYGYYKADTEYNNLAQVYVTPVVEETPEATEETPVVEEEKYPKLMVQFGELMEENEDFRGWLYMPLLELSYPIVQADDNEYYLTKTFTRETNSSGSIFMDCYNMSDFRNYNTFLYGHNMKNGSMFGNLKRLYREEGLTDQDPYFYIYSPEGVVLKYRIYAYYITGDNSDSYDYIETEEQYEKQIALFKSRSVYKCDDEIKLTDPTVTLSTCSGTDGNKRFLVHGYLSEVFYD